MMGCVPVIKINCPRSGVFLKPHPGVSPSWHYHCLPTQSTIFSCTLLYHRISLLGMHVSLPLSLSAHTIHNLQLHSPLSQGFLIRYACKSSTVMGNRQVVFHSQQIQIQNVFLYGSQSSKKDPKVTCSMCGWGSNGWRSNGHTLWSCIVVTCGEHPCQYSIVSKSAPIISAAWRILYKHHSPSVCMCVGVDVCEVL